MFYERQCDHDWTKWEMKEEGGVEIMLRGPSTGRLINFSRVWQERVCNKCGQRETNLLREIPDLGQRDIRPF